MSLEGLQTAIIIVLGFIGGYSIRTGFDTNTNYQRLFVGSAVLGLSMYLALLSYGVLTAAASAITFTALFLVGNYWYVTRTSRPLST